jgi:hypothetical protein
MSRASGLVASLLLLLPGACGKSRSKYDVFLEGQRIEEAAGKNECRLQYVEGGPMMAASLSGDAIGACLRRTEEALALYDEAAAMGMTDHDFQIAHARAQERVAKMREMLANVRDIEFGRR